MKGMNHRMIRAGLVQLVCPHYRVPFFRELAGKVDLLVFHGKGEEKGSWQNSKKINGFKHTKLFSLILKFTVNDFMVRLVLFPALLFKLHKFKPEVIISEGLTNVVNNVFIWLFCRAAAVPWIVWDSGRKKEKPMGLLRRCVELLNIFLLKKAKAVLAYGSVAREYFISLGITPEKIFVAHNTLDMGACMRDARRFEADPKLAGRVRDRLGLDSGRTILYVGALEKRKKIHTLINAFAALRREFPRINLVIVGDGGYKKTLAQMVAERHIKNCRFIGRITDGVGEFFALADIFVLPGRGGLAVNQAMAYGLPVVVGQGDGTEADLVENGVNGFPVKDTAGLMWALRMLLADNALSRRMGAAGRKIIGRYTLHHMINRFMEAIGYVMREDILP